MFKVVPLIVYAQLRSLQPFVKRLQVLVLGNIFKGLCNLTFEVLFIDCISEMSLDQVK